MGSKSEFQTYHLSPYLVSRACVLKWFSPFIVLYWSSVTWVVFVSYDSRWINCEYFYPQRRARKNFDLVILYLDLGVNWVDNMVWFKDDFRKGKVGCRFYSNFGKFG